MLNSGAYDRPTKTCIPGLDWNNCKDLSSVDVTSVEHTKLAREVAAASVVMLQNDGVLPISRTSRVLVLGFACSVDQFTDGSWDGDYYVNGGSGRLLSPRTASVLKGIVEVGAKVTQGPKNDNVWDALEAMRRSSDHDVVIACGGVTSGEGSDRSSLQLDQHEFLVQLAAENAKLAKPMPLVIVTMSAGAILTDFRTNANAILSTFLTGQETGRAVADVLFGDVNPSGRLPVTFPQKEDDLTQVCWDMHCGFTEGLNVGWKNLINKAVAFPFGHGLSYGGSMAFRYDWADQPAPMFDVNGADDGYEFSVVVQNNAAHQGREVAQLYLKFPTDAGEPEKVLRGYHRTSLLLPDRSEKVIFKLFAKDVSIWSEHAHKWQIASGTYCIEVGSSSRDVRLVGHFKVVGPELEPTPEPTSPSL
jgi:beta-glucosidase